MHGLPDLLPLNYIKHASSIGIDSNANCRARRILINLMSESVTDKEYGISIFIQRNDGCTLFYNDFSGISFTTWRSGFYFKDCHFRRDNWVCTSYQFVWVVH